MWKDKINRKDISLYSTYIIKGFNVDRLLNSCKKRGVELLNIKKLKDNLTELTIKYKDRKKFFAIVKDLCYNIKDIKEIKTKGFFYPLLYLFKNIGVLIGVILFVLITSISNDFIFSFNFCGTGSAIKSDITSYLNSQGINKYTRFSKIDLSRLEDTIMANFDRLSFVSCTKKGNTLNIESTLEKQDKTPYLNQSQLVSNVEGKIESIKLYRGKSLFNEGDYIKNGDILITASYDDNLLSSQNVIASVSIICEKTVKYETEVEQSEDIITALLLEEVSETLEPLSLNIKSEIIEGKYIYTLSVFYRCVLYAI